MSQARSPSDMTTGGGYGRFGLWTTARCSGVRLARHSSSPSSSPRISDPAEGRTLVLTKPQASSRCGPRPRQGRRPVSSDAAWIIRSPARSAGWRTRPMSSVPFTRSRGGSTVLVWLAGTTTRPPSPSAASARAQTTRTARLKDSCRSP